jgi:hypothetical protein
MSTQGNLQCISNAIWAFATVGFYATDVFKAVATPACVGRILKMVGGKPNETTMSQGLSNILWGYAKIGAVTDRDYFTLFKQYASLWAVICSNSRQRTTSQNIANTLWAYVSYWREWRGGRAASISSASKL